MLKGKSDASRAQLNKAPPKPIFYKYVDPWGYPIYWTADTWDGCRGPRWYWDLMHADDVDDCCIPKNATIININAIIADIC